MTTTQLQPRAQAQLTEMREQLLARIEQQRGERIHDKRLEAAPLALRCLPCQTAFEKQPVTI